MQSRLWKILLVEDDEDDYILTRELLSEAKAGQFELEWVSTYEDALDTCVEKQHDVYLIDYRLGHHDGLELVRETVNRGCKAPIILMTGQGSYDVDLEAMKAGVDDYLVKSEINGPLLERTIRYAIERKQSQEALKRAHDELELRVQERTQELLVINQELEAEIVERRQAQGALSESETRFRKLAESTSTAIFIVQNGHIRYANPAARIITGYTPQELVHKEFWEIAHPTYQKILQQYGLASHWIDQFPSRYELKLLTKNGQERWVDLSSGSMEFEGKPALVVTAFDITERDQAEKALKRAKEELEIRVDERTAELRQANEQLAEANLKLGNANQQLQTVLQALPVAVWIANATGRIIEKNAMADQIWGGSAPLASDISGYDEYQGWWADSGAAVKADEWPLARAIKEGETVVGDIIDIERFDGARATLLSSAAPIFDTKGCVIGGVAVGQDITVQRQLEQQAKIAASQAQQRAEELDAVFSAMSDTVIVYSANGVALQANPAAIQAYGFDPVNLTSQAIHKRLSIRYPDGSLVPFKNFPASRALRGEAITGERFTLINAEGRKLSMVVAASPLVVNDRLLGAVVVWHDMTELERLLAQLEAERAKLSTIIANAPEAIVMADKNSRILLANPAAERLFARPIPFGQDFSSHVELEFCYPDGTPCDVRDLPLTRSALDGETLSNLELAITWPNGQHRDILASSAPILDRLGTVNGAIAIFQDMTQRKQAEAEMRRDAARIEVQRHLIQFREMERLDIAQDLHDGPLQELIGIAYSLTDILQLISGETVQPEPLSGKLYSVQDRLKQQIRDLRVFCSELRPPTLVPFGLEKAIRSHAEAFQSRHPGLDIILDLSSDGHRLPEQIRMALFRIYQEMLNNVARHSGAGEVKVHFSLDDEHAWLEIEDNGSGFQVPTSWVELARQGHLGLVGAQERAEAVGSTLQVTSVTGEGTTVRVVVPRNSIHVNET